MGNYGMNSNVNNNFGGTNSNVPTNNWSGNTNTGGGSDPYNMNPDNNQPKLEPPYYGNEVEKTAENDINFIEQPVVPPQPAEPTNEVPQQPNNNNNNNNYNDPSIISRPKNSNRSTSFFAQPGTLAAVIGGAVVGLLCAILCVMFVVYRIERKMKVRMHWMNQNDPLQSTHMLNILVESSMPNNDISKTFISHSKK